MNEQKSRTTSSAGAVEYTGLSKHQLLQLVHGGELPTIRINSRVYRFEISDLDRYLDSRKTEVSK